MAKGFTVSVLIGGKILPSLGNAVRATESQIGKLTRGVKLRAAETRLALKEMTAAVTPIASMAAAAGLGTGLKGIFGQGAEWQHQISMMRIAGRTNAEVAASTAAAWRAVSQVPTATLNDSLKTIGETTLAFGGLQHAIDNLTFNQKMGGLLKNVLGDDFDQGTAFNQLVRALELRSGKMSPATYQRQANALFKAMVVSHGTVNPEGFLGFAQQAGLAMRGYSERFLASVVPSLIQEMGAERAGTAATAMFNQFMGRVSVGGKSLTQEWVRLGLVPAKGTGGNLSATGWTPGTLKDNPLAMADPLKWFETVLFPALRAHGVDTNNRDQMLIQMQKMFGRETGKRLASTFGDPRQLARIHADMALYGRAQGVNDAYKSGLKNDPKMQADALRASLTNMETALGKAATPVLVPIMNGLAKAFNSMAGVFDRHPMFAKGVVALMGLGLVSASLKAVGIGLRFALSPLKLFSGAWRLMFSAVGKAGPRVPWIVSLGRSLASAAPAIAEVAAGVGEALGAITAPVWGIAVAGAATLAAAGIFIARNWRGVKTLFGHMLAPLAPLGAGLANLGAAFGRLGSALGGAVWQRVRPLAAWFGGIASTITSKFASAFGWLDRLIGPIAISRWATWGDTVARAIRMVTAPLTWLANTAARGVGSLATLLSGSPTARGGAIAGKRALGGPVSGGRPYVVGEGGEEIFIPRGSGTIIPARRTARMLAGGHGRDRRDAGGASSVTYNSHFTINGSNASEIARAVDRRLRDLSRQHAGALHD